MGLAAQTKRLVTVEENTLAGGFGSAILQLIQASGLSDVKVECIGLPDGFVEHGPQELLRAMFALDSDGIAQRIRVSFPELFARGHSS
jgi:1-deoxy-D-xylulose-5-phosphate synthase